MDWISENSFVVHGRRESLAVQLVDARDYSYGAPAWLPNAEHVLWGARDNKPNAMKKIAQANGQILATLDTNRDMLHGVGLTFKKRVIEGDRIVDTYPVWDQRLEDLRFAQGLDEYFIESIIQHLASYNHFTRMQYTKDGVLSLSISDYFYTRIGKPKKGQTQVSEYHVNPSFGDWNYRLKETEKIPAFDVAYPKAYPLSILHSKIPRDGNPFYSYPSWWASEEWLALSNLIPLFHKSGIQNGYNLKYLIKIPQDYFDGEGGREESEEAVRAKWRDFSRNLSDWMSGVRNVNKTMIVKYLRGEDGKALDSIDVQSIKNEMADDAYSKVWEMANVSTANSVGILPTLAGVNPGKGNDSGSQIRVMAEFQQHFRTPVARKILLRPIQIWLRENGFPSDIFPDIDGVQITTLDTNKSSQPVNNGSQGS